MVDIAPRVIDRWSAPPHLVEGLLDHLRNGTTALMDEIMFLDHAIFSDPAIARRENEGIFGTVPFIAAHSSELAEPNDFIAKRLPRNEVILSRQADGSVKAFVNMCRHRGSRLTAEPEGHCRRFTCPYHGWSYDTAGSLKAITFPASFGDAPVDQLGLVELAVEERHGFVWIVDSPGASIDVERWLGPDIDAIMGSFGLDELVCFRARGYEEPINWKILYDAFLDGYHIKFVHQASAAKLIHSNTYVVEDYGNHSRFASPRKSLDQWLDHPPADDEPMLGHIMVALRLGPNATLLQLEDNFQLLSFAPVSDNPGESVMEMRLLVPPADQTDFDEDAWRARWEKNWHILQVVLTGEDFPILRDIQHAHANQSGAGSVLGRNEVNNQAFHREAARLRNA